MHTDVRLKLDEGAVACPRRPGRTDVEHCYGCPAFRRIGGRDDRFVVCRQPRGAEQLFATTL